MMEKPNLRHPNGNAGPASRPAGRALRQRVLSFSVLLATLGACGCTADRNPEARPLDVLSMNQCQRSLDGIHQRLDDVKKRIAAGSAQADVLEELQLLRQDVPAAETKCVASKAAVQEIRSIDKELDEIELRLSMEGYR